MIGEQADLLSLLSCCPRLRYSVFFQMLIIWWFKHIPMELLGFTNKTLQSPGWLQRTHTKFRVNTCEKKREE